jgi:thioredoxin-like negative regulator of GroEL
MKTLHATLSALALAAALSLSPADAGAAPGLPSTNVTWIAAASDADVDRAFAQARAQNKPVLLYWGATWCPPCNQLKATLFNRADFAAQSKAFVAVHVDGDRPGAQKLSQRFKVSGYPTVVLFKPDGSEITRLPGEADAPQVMAVLQQGLSGGRAAQAVLADALAGKPLTGNDWRVLAFYSWETSEARLVPKNEVAGTLVQLAAASAGSADAETHTRLWLKAVAASDAAQGVKPDAALRERVLKVLADPVQARAQMDVLSNSADDIVRTLTPEGEPAADRARLLAAFDAALLRFEADATLSRADRLGALLARVELARVDQPSTAVQVALPAPLQQAVRAHITRADREIRDGYERQAVITAAAYAYGRAGLWADSNALLQSNLAKSHSPYYLMSQLGSNERKLGHNAQALDWYAQSYAKSEGPATRLQWGSGYLSALVDLAPQDGKRIEQTMSQLLKDAAGDEAAFEGRSARSLQRAADKLKAWNAAAPQAPVMKRLQTQLNGVCAKVDAASGQRATCQALLKPASPEA